MLSKNIFVNAFHKVDEEVKFSDSEHMGTTACVVYITKEKDLTGFNSYRKAVYCGNVGDSRCVVVNNFSAKRLSYDHKASDPSEIERVTSAGGVIFGGRVFGQLMLTRAIGDYALKKYGVISTPYMNKYFVSEKDKYLILASDGVWDVINDDEMFRLSNTVSNSDEFCKVIIKNSLLRGSRDNMSCLVIKLN